MAWPTDINVKDEGRRLEVVYDDGFAALNSAESLRVNSPSAEVQGHGPGQRVEVKGKENVRIVDIEPIGNYAIRIVFDDGHGTGIYTWEYLRELSLRRAQA
jgi:DUF971 family protein